MDHRGWLAFGCQCSPHHTSIHATKFWPVQAQTRKPIPVCRNGLRRMKPQYRLAFILISDSAQNPNLGGFVLNRAFFVSVLIYGFRRRASFDALLFIIAFLSYLGRIFTRNTSPRCNPTRTAVEHKITARRKVLHGSFVRQVQFALQDAVVSHIPTAPNFQNPSNTTNSNLTDCSLSSVGGELAARSGLNHLTT